MKPKKILFVCYGNICRSPSAEGIFRTHAESQGLGEVFKVDSAGTHDFHIGKAPDARAIKAAAKHGFDLSALQARQVQVSDFDQYDHIYVMDQKNWDNLLTICPPDMAHKIEAFVQFVPNAKLDHIHDPFHDGPDEFDEMMSILDLACLHAIRHLSDQNS